MSESGPSDAVEDQSSGVAQRDTGCPSTAWPGHTQESLPSPRVTHVRAVTHTHRHDVAGRLCKAGAAMTWSVRSAFPPVWPP